MCCTSPVLAFWQEINVRVRLFFTKEICRAHSSLPLKNLCYNFFRSIIVQELIDFYMFYVTSVILGKVNLFHLCFNFSYFKMTGWHPTVEFQIGILLEDWRPVTGPYGDSTVSYQSTGQTASKLGFFYLGYILWTKGFKVPNWNFQSSEIGIQTNWNTA